MCENILSSEVEEFEIEDFMGLEEQFFLKTKPMKTTHNLYLPK